MAVGSNVRTTESWELVALWLETSEIETWELELRQRDQMLYVSPWLDQVAT